MNTHQMKLSINPFNKIKDGKKVIECRLYDDKRKTIELGDLIEFKNSENELEKINTKVKAIYRYESFQEMYRDFDPSLFGGTSTDELVKEINTFYSIDEQSKFGVVGFKIGIE